MVIFFCNVFVIYEFLSMKKVYLVEMFNKYKIENVKFIMMMLVIFVVYIVFLILLLVSMVNIKYFGFCFNEFMNLLKN